MSNPVQSLLVVHAKVRAGSASDGEAWVDRALRLIAAEGNPASGGAARALDASGIVHFASFAVVPCGGAPAASSGFALLLELNLDGPRRQALKVLADHAGEWLGAVFACADWAGAESLAQYLDAHVIDFRPTPFGAVGLNYNGLPEFTVQTVARQRALAGFLRDATAYYAEQVGGGGRSALDVLRFVRNLIAPSGMHPLPEGLTGDLSAWRARGAAFAPDLNGPPPGPYDIGAWRSGDLVGAAAMLALGPLQLAGAGLFLALFLILRLGVFSAIARLFGQSAGVGLVASLSGLTPALFIAVGGAVAGLAWGLRRQETANTPEDAPPDFAQMVAINAVENAPGYRQNHYLGVVPMMPGVWGRVRLALGLFAVKVMVSKLYRPGFAVDMGTIHFARWFKLPGADTLIFQTTFDGSWESYLEDFITKAHPGQTGVWSVGLGFPATRFLFGGGAADGDRFKRWIRRRQVVAPFWYSRFPDLTTDQKRTNGLLHQGLCTAKTESEARAWLDLLGGVARPAGEVETAEVQSLILRGFADRPHGLTLALVLPEPEAARAWLAECAALGEYAVAYGQAASGDSPVVSIGLSARGLGKLGLSGAEPQLGLNALPAAFRMGMSARGRVLGDAGADQSRAWSWGDDEAEAILHVLGATEADCQAAVRAHLEALPGVRVLETVRTLMRQDPATGAVFEPFGFRDGVSQPVLSGLGRPLSGTPERDRLAPGEFILGYPDGESLEAGRRLYPPALLVNSATDRADDLPTRAAESPLEYPDFSDAGPQPQLRDFGRNGAFIAVRRLRQDVAAFNTYAESEARRLQSVPQIQALIGEPVSADWVAAKIVGRRRDGTPLTGGAPGDNDFDHGVDDPRGLACPLGAHIRRANPRTSLHPENPVQQSVTNRRRLLRRGRSYHAVDDGEGATRAEEGLLFIAVCADLERQFEFVQQTWLGGPAFHRLDSEVDPLVCGGPGYTVPTPAGSLRFRPLPDFVAVRAGGYFFLPSRSALRYLSRL